MLADSQIPMSPFSQRSRHDLEENELTRALARAKERGEVLDLTVSNPTTAGIAPLSDRGRLALASASVATYAPLPFGLPETRAAIAASTNDLGISLSPEDVICTASTSEAYAWLFSLLADPGDTILVPQPSYPLFEYLAAYQSVRLVPYPLRYDGAWHVDLPALRELRSREPRARAVLVVSPNNPTGSTLKADELEAILDLDLPLVSDEVFLRYPIVERATPLLSALTATRGLVFVLSGLSKEAALPQMKLGWIALAGDRALRDEAKARLEVLADTFLSVGTPVQAAASVLLEDAHLARDRILARARTNLATLDRVVAGTAATRLHLEAGIYATLHLPAIADEDTWVHTFLDAGVYVHPGAFFDFHEGPRVVLSLLTDETTFARGVAKLAAAITTLVG